MMNKVAKTPAERIWEKKIPRSQDPGKIGGLFFTVSSYFSFFTIHYYLLPPENPAREGAKGKGLVKSEEWIVNKEKSRAVAQDFWLPLLGSNQRHRD